MCICDLAKLLCLTVGKYILIFQTGKLGSIILHGHVLYFRKLFPEFFRQFSGIVHEIDHKALPLAPTEQAAAKESYNLDCRWN